MEIKAALTQADELRPNTLREEQKAGWIRELEVQFSFVTGEAAPEDRWPEDYELSIPKPYDGVYVQYLAAMIDLANQETGLYANDMTLFNATWSGLIAWWRRGHDPDRRQRWKGL